MELKGCRPQISGRPAEKSTRIYRRNNLIQAFHVTHRSWKLGSEKWVDQSSEKPRAGSQSPEC